MPILSPGASDFTANVRASAETNAAVSIASLLASGGTPPKRSSSGGGRLVSPGAGAIVTQSATAKSSGLQPAFLRVPPPPSRNVSKTLESAGGYSGYFAKYTTSGEILWATKSSEAITTVDSNGNIIVAGAVPGNYYNSDGSQSTVTVGTLGNYSIANYNSDGIFQWSLNSSIAISSIITDSSGNIYFTSTSGSDINYYSRNSDTISNTINAGGNSIYLAKISSDGVFQWSTILLMSNNTNDKIAIAVDLDQNVYVSGCSRGIGNPAITSFYNSDTSVFGTTLSELIPSDQGLGFIVKYDSTGFVQWCAKFDNPTIPQSEQPYSIVTDSGGNVYIVGNRGYSYFPLQIFDASGTLTTTIPTTNGSIDGMIIKYSPIGTPLWGVYIAANVHDGVFGISSPDTNGDFYVTGYFTASTGNAINGVVFQSTDENNVTITPNPDISTSLLGGFIAKYTSAGVCLWATRIVGLGSSQDVKGYAITTDSNNNLFITGSNYNTYTVSAYDVTDNVVKTVDLIGLYSIFVANYSSSGVPQWISAINGEGDDYKLAQSITFRNGFIYVSGTSRTPTTVFLSS